MACSFVGKYEQVNTYMFHGKFHCIKAINVRKKNIVQMRPLTAEIKVVIKFRATASRGIRKIFRVVIYVRKKLV